jgi:DNA-binding helix-hairpin-helix protein with protein kinase domain
MPLKTPQLGVETDGTGSEGPWVGEEVVVVPTTVDVIVVVEVSVLEEEETVVSDDVVTVEVVDVLDDVQTTIASSPSPPWQPLPADTGRAALDVLSPMASDVTKNTKTNPTRTKVPLLVLSFVAVNVDPVNIVLKYRSEIYIMVPKVFTFSKTPN